MIVSLEDRLNGSLALRPCHEKIAVSKVLIECGKLCKLPIKHPWGARTVVLGFWLLRKGEQPTVIVKCCGINHLSGHASSRPGMPNVAWPFNAFEPSRSLAPLTPRGFMQLAKGTHGKPIRCRWIGLVPFFGGMDLAAGAHPARAMYLVAGRLSACSDVDSSEACLGHGRIGFCRAAFVPHAIGLRGRSYSFRRIHGAPPTKNRQARAKAYAPRQYTDSPRSGRQRYPDLDERVQQHRVLPASYVINILWKQAKYHWLQFTTRSNDFFRSKISELLGSFGPKFQFNFA